MSDFSKGDIENNYSVIIYVRIIQFIQFSLCRGHRKVSLEILWNHLNISGYQRYLTNLPGNWFDFVILPHLKQGVDKHGT